MPAYDVAVLGLGGMGSAAAAHLARRGKRVLGLEQFSSPHDRGSSHGKTRVIRQAYFEHPAYVPLLLRAYELWRELETETSSQLLLLPGGLMIGRQEAEVVRGSLASARQYGLAHELLDAPELRRRYPQFQISDDTVALFEKAAGLVFCERAIQAHLMMAARHGAALHFHEPVLGWEAGKNISIRTHRGTYEAEQLVICPGAWAPEIFSQLRLPLTVERQVLFWFSPSGGTTPFLPDRFPIYIWQREDGAMPYGFPALDDFPGTVKISYYRKPSSEPCHPESIDRSIRPDDLASIQQAVRQFLPGLEGPLAAAVTCMYTLTPDFHFLIGEHPEDPRVKMAAGFSGHGFKFCSVVGEILADLAIQGKTAHPIDLFSPTRFR